MKKNATDLNDLYTRNSQNWQFYKQQVLKSVQAPFWCQEFINLSLAIEVQNKSRMAMEKYIRR